MKPTIRSQLNRCKRRIQKRLDRSAVRGNDRPMFTASNLHYEISERHRALLTAASAPVDNLESNWAYMVMTALAWNLKAWLALLLPESPGRWQEQHRTEKSWLLGLEFKTFVQAFLRLPCQIVRTGGRLVFRLLSWNPHLPVFFRLLDVLRC